jgi:hypothetical protein
MSSAPRSGLLFRFRFALFLLIPFLVPQLTHACSCIGPNPACAAWKGAAVFRGRVLSQTLDDGEIRVRFAVMEAFHGVPQSRDITVTTAEQSSACGFAFENGREYLVYAHEASDPGVLATSKCTRTHLLEPGQDDSDLVFLRSLPTMPKGGSIFGSVFAHPDQPNLPLAGTIRIRGPEDRDVALDEKGKFEFSGLPPGKYTITAVFPPGVTENPPEKSRTVDVADKACAESDFQIVSDGHIRGRVTDFDGKPMSEVFTILYVFDADSTDGRRQVSSQMTATDGHYDFVGVPPGDYVVSANDLGPSPGNPYPRLYYTAAKNSDQPATIHLGQAQHLDEIDIAFSRPWRLITVPVRVLLSDGSPAVAAEFSAYDSDYQYSGEPFTAVPDSRGNATISVYEGRTYYLTAIVNGENQHCGGPLKFLAKSDQVLEPIVIEHNWGNCLAQLNPSFVPPN